VDRYATAAPYASNSATSTPVTNTITPGNAIPVDRYAMPTNSTTAVPTAAAPIDRYASVPVETATPAVPAASATAIDPYAPPAAELSSYPATSGLASQTPTAVPVSTSPAAFPSTPPNSPITAPVPASLNPTATVQIKSPVGQYRPGGTSSYASGAADSRIDVASRPTSSTVTPSAAPQSPPAASDPWAPPATAPTATPAPAPRIGGSVSAGGSSVY
jgi:hypothetical protein